MTLPPFRQSSAERPRHLPPGRPEPFEDVDEADLVHRPGVAEALETFLAVIGADPARADSAEGKIFLRDVKQGAVEGHAARNRPVEDSLALPPAVAEAIERQ